MKSAARGAHTSRVEVGNVSAHGFWLLVGERELFLPFAKFPWFREAPVGAILNVERPAPDHLFWPDLDVDLSVECIEHPEKFPLVCRPSGPTRKPPAPRRRPAGKRRGSD
jgi:hypothetical protein